MHSYRGQVGPGIRRGAGHETKRLQSQQSHRGGENGDGELEHDPVPWDYALISVDPTRPDRFCGLRTIDADPIHLAGSAENEVVPSETMAEGLNAAIGDVVTVFYRNQPFRFTVAALARDDPLSGHRNPTTGGSGKAPACTCMPIASGKCAVRESVEVLHWKMGRGARGRPSRASTAPAG